MRISGGVINQQTISAAVTEYSIWGTSTLGTQNIDQAENTIVLGTKFKSNTNGQIVAGRWQRINGQAGGTSIALFQGTTNLSGTQAISGQTTSGWQRQNFSSPVSITSGTIYTIALLSPGNPTAYYATSNYFNSATVNGPLTAVASSESLNGVYTYSSTMVAPTNNFLNGCYYIDVVFTA